MRRSGVSGLCHRPDEAVASNRAARRSPVDRLVFLTATCPSLHLLRSDASPGRGTRLSANPTIVSFTYGDMRHFCIRMPSRSHRRRRYKIGERCGGAPVRGARDGSWARSRRGGRLRGSGGGGSGRPRPCRPSRSLRSPPRGSRRRGPGPGTPRSASSSLNPRARTSSKRARRLSDVLAGRGTFSRVTRRARGPGRARAVGTGRLGRGLGPGPRRPWGGAPSSRVERSDSPEAGEAHKTQGLVQEPHGGPGRTRTDDRRGVNALLYQLSYGSVRFRGALVAPRGCGRTAAGARWRRGTAPPHHRAAVCTVASVPPAGHADAAPAPAHRGHRGGVHAGGAGGLFDVGGGDGPRGAGLGGQDPD